MFLYPQSNSIKTCANNDYDSSRFMRVAFIESQKMLGRTWPNPSVGVVIVANEDGYRHIVAKAATAKGGRPHGEVVALAQAGNKAMGGDMYVTLEPCFHYGLTDPCTEAIVAAGIKRVFIAMTDPDQRTCGQGMAALRRAGIDVIEGVEESMAKKAHEGHIRRILSGRPHVTLKQAIAADGMIGVYGHGKIRISSQDSDNFVHMLRARTDAVMIGIGTALADNPYLTCRLAGMEQCSPLRIVLDSKNVLPADSNLIRAAASIPTWLITSDDKLSRYQGVNCLAADVESNGRFDLSSVLTVLGRLGITRLLIEAGKELATSLLAAKLVDRFIAIKSPIKIGQGGVLAVVGGNLEDMLFNADLNLVDDIMMDRDHILFYERPNQYYKLLQTTDI